MRFANSFLASAGVAIAVTFTVITVVLFCSMMFVLWWIEVKKKTIKDLGNIIKSAFINFFDKVYEIFSPEKTVRTVYSDKSLNYSGTEFLPIPTKAPTNQYTYEFVGWDKNGTDEKGNIVVRAIYLQKVTKCTINVYDDDRATLFKTLEVEYGSGVNLSDIVPSKNETQEFSYEFIGWDKDITAFYNNENVYAVYKAIPKKYTYVFYDEDGESVINSGTAIYGTPIYAPANPVKESDSEFVYEFAGWKGYQDGMQLTANCAFYATFDKKPVTVSGNSAIIKTQEGKVKVVPESSLSEKEDSSKKDLYKAQPIDFSSKKTEQKDPNGEVKEGNIVSQINRNLMNKTKNKNGVIIEQNNLEDAEKFKNINRANVEELKGDKDVHQKIQLMTIKESKNIKEKPNGVIKAELKEDQGFDEKDALANLVVNQLPIDSKD